MTKSGKRARQIRKKREDLFKRYKSFSGENEPCCSDCFYEYVLCVRSDMCPDWMYRGLCVCCFWGTNERKVCAFTILYSKVYYCIYFVIIGITVTLVIYDLDKHRVLSGVQTEPVVMKALDVFCVCLMVFDIFMQILANPRKYWTSCTNIRVLNTAKRDIVDFSSYEDSFLIDYVQGKSAPPPQTHQTPHMSALLVGQESHSPHFAFVPTTTVVVSKDKATYNSFQSNVSINGRDHIDLDYGHITNTTNTNINANDN
ncbi:hypothetical protein RFI_25829, partial [Reticulomyxa filosa]